MKNLFAFGFLALGLTVASCNNTTKTEETADSLTNVIDSTATALTDSINATADSATAVVDSIADSVANAQ
ncbi:MAG: hypothetical protein ACI35V_03435 [Sphingobacterium composti]|uniref:hypothetical protein n=1 Tax=Sphingobacterium composti TaxID=363260 RepID=UPI00135B35B6|nr:hypothetical protein [Sphingobacterium composti Ten et al. 2007 non Yoo et al. 2007]